MPILLHWPQRFLLGLLLSLSTAIAADTNSNHAIPSNTDSPPLMLANSYHSAIDLDDYWVSEKLDGVRAYWNGHHLISRGGQVFTAPSWFTQDFPDQPLDGELWMGRSRFAEVSGAVRRQTPNPQQWRQIHFMVFDLPAHKGDFNHRLAAMQTLFAKTSSPYIQLVKQQKMATKAQLMTHLDTLIAQGAEGLMLHLGSAPYRAKRSDDLLKLKRYQDAEATVVKHLPGKGKYRGMMGALLVEMPNGRQFKLGSGFSDDQRRQPPAPGTTVTYKYYGLTNSGLPRFASFMRIRRGH